MTEEVEVSLMQELDKATAAFKKRVLKKMWKSRLPGLPMVLTHELNGQRAIVLSNTGLWLYPMIRNYNQYVPDWFLKNPQAAPDDYWRIYATEIRLALDGLGL